MNMFDLILLLIVAGCVILGYVRGLINQLLSIAGLFAAFLIAYLYHRDLAPYLLEKLPLSSFENYNNYEFLIKGLHLDIYAANVLAFALLFFGVKIVLSIVKRILNGIAYLPGLNFLNRTLGAAFGLLEGVLIVVILVNVMTIIPSDNMQSQLAGSSLAPYILEQFPALTGKLHEHWKSF